MLQKCLSLKLYAANLGACQPDQNDPELDTEVRAQFAGTYQLYRPNQQGTIGQDTSTTFEGFVEMD